ncbi:MAG: ABC transporter permease [Actinomycetia bacterium]|nr:ABC transporter permease [Actinomycetes bacterium]
MSTTLLTKSIRDRWVTTTVSTVALLLLALFTMGIYSGFDAQVGALFADLPDALAAIYGVQDGTTAGLVVSALFAVLAPLIILAYAIPGASAAATGEERSATLDLLLMNPVSRTRVYLTKSGVLAVGIILICVVLWLGSDWIAAAVGLDLSGQNTTAACLQLAGLGLMFAGLALAVGGWTGTALGATVASVVAAFSYLVTTLLGAVPDFAQISKFTPWYLYSGNDPLQSGVSWWALGVMLLAAIVLGAIGATGLNRRDLRG